MKRWYTVKVKYNKKSEEEGKDPKKVNEAFLFQAVSFTDAEARINKEIGQTAVGEFLVHSMSITEMTDVVRGDGGSWYTCKTISEYEDDGKKYKDKYSYMVEAESVNHASDMLDESLKDAMFTYEITNVALSPVVDVFHPDLDIELSRTTVESN